MRPAATASSSPPVGADETAVIDALLAAPGGMPSFSALTDQQIADIAAFVVAM